jgi:DNA-binding IclR family transcriptional regulator
MERSTARIGLGEGAATGGGSQTLLRGLDIIEAVSRAPLPLGALAAELSLTKSTAHRLATSLVDRGYLSAVPRGGYRLGPKLLDLGSRAQRQLDLIQVARPHLEALAQQSGDTVHLGKLPGSRRIEISSRVGERQPLTTTGLGKALLLDEGAADWDACFAAEQPGGDAAAWQQRMADYAACGHAFDLEENEDRIRCVAAPLRGAGGGIAGAISVSSAAQYLDDGRLVTLADQVRAAAAAISADLGWTSGQEK